MKKNQLNRRLAMIMLLLTLFPSNLLPNKLADAGVAATHRLQSAGHVKAHYASASDVRADTIPPALADYRSPDRRAKIQRWLIIGFALFILLLLTLRLTKAVDKKIKNQRWD